MCTLVHAHQKLVRQREKDRERDAYEVCSKKYDGKTTRMCLKTKQELTHSKCTYVCAACTFVSPCVLGESEERKRERRRVKRSLRVNL